jgi:hypothetical protein
MSETQMMMMIDFPLVLVVVILCLFLSVGFESERTGFASFLSWVITYD